jgi:hypothetical protein
MTYKKDRYQEILDGKRAWNKNDNAGGDPDVFYSQFVIPLRDLKHEGLFDKLVEHTGNYRGRSDIDILHLIGAVDPEFRFEESEED